MFKLKSWSTRAYYSYWSYHYLYVYPPHTCPWITFPVHFESFHWVFSKPHNSLVKWLNLFIQRHKRISPFCGHDLRPKLQIPTAISPPLSCHLYVSDWWLKAALWPSRSYRKSPAYPSPQWTKKAMRAPMSVINLSFINPVNPWQPAMNPSRCNLRMLLIRDVINPDLALFVLMLSLWRTLARFLALFWLHCRCK